MDILTVIKIRIPIILCVLILTINCDNQLDKEANVKEVIKEYLEHSSSGEIQFSSFSTVSNRDSLFENMMDVKLLLESHKLISEKIRDSLVIELNLLRSMLDTLQKEDIGYSIFCKYQTIEASGQQSIVEEIFYLDNTFNIFKVEEAAPYGNGVILPVGGGIDAAGRL